MGLHETDLSLSPAYQEQMLSLYSAETVRTIAEDWQHADLAHQPGEKILYVRLGAETATGPRPVLYVPGYTEGIVAKAPFAAELAEKGFDVILPGQNRKKILRDSLSKKNATHSQAMNYLAVITAEGLDDQTVDVVTHSYGSLIFQAMQRVAHDRGQSTFQGAKLVELAPAGTNADESLLRLGARFARHMISESRTQKDFPDPKNEMMKAGTKNMLANFPRTVRETLHLARTRLDYNELALSGLASITVLGYAEDKLFPHRILASTIEKAWEDNLTVSYATPISLQSVDGKPRGGKDASHNDEQFNPLRVAGAVAQILRG